MFHKSGVEIWSGSVCNFRRRVVRIWAQMAWRAYSQMANIIPGNPIAFEGMPTDGLLAGIVCLSPTLAGSLRDADFAQCCRKHGRWGPEYLEGLEIIQYLPPNGEPAILWLSLQKIVEIALWVWMGLRKRAWNRREGGRAQLLFWKNVLFCFERMT